MTKPEVLLWFFIFSIWIFMYYWITYCDVIMGVV
jgi:hypothetical protein